jgi:tol-pal system protein YbgF
MMRIVNKTLRLGATSLMSAAMIAALGAPAQAARPAGAPPHPAEQPHYVRVAGLFGESDEEKAARQREQAQDASIASLTQRVSDLEHSLRDLTGQLEQANHRADVLQQRLERMRKDFEYRLCMLSADKLGASGDDQNGLNCTPGGQSAGYLQQGSAAPPDATVSGAATPSSGDTVELSPPPGSLGTLPAGTAMPKPNPSVSVNTAALNKDTSQGAAAPRTSGSRKQFDAAMNLLAKAQYDEARSAFRGFADAYPKDDLAPQAVYWVGSIAYVQKDYPGAARAFAEEIKEYPHSPRSPESMLKLGRSLIAMKQKQEGCTTLGAISSKYPRASRTILREASKARHEARCR